jgi:RecA/RadA recombinase
LDQGESFTDNTKKILTHLYSIKRKSVTGFASMSEIRQAMIPVKEIILQKAIGGWGFKQGRIVEIIGSFGLGKTTLSLTLAGYGMSAGCPAMFLECESKPLERARIIRTMHTSPAIANRMLNLMHKDKAHSLEEMVFKCNNWAELMRGKIKGPEKLSINVPKDTPIIIVVDTFSKLLNPDEAAGRYNFGGEITDKQKEKKKEIGHVANFGHAKFAQAWSRWLPTFLDQYNVLLIVTHQQNDDVDMSGGFSPSYLPQYFKDLDNTTVIGGKALGQLASYRLTLAECGAVKDPTNTFVIGKRIKMKVHKNSAARDKDVIEYHLLTRHADQFPHYLDPALHFEESTCKWLADEGLLGVTASDNMYTCRDLNIIGAAPVDFMKALYASPDTLFRLGHQLKLDGYFDIVAEMQESIALEAQRQRIAQEQAAAAAPTQPEVSEETSTEIVDQMMSLANENAESSDSEETDEENET